MSGRALYPVTMNLYDKLVHEFDGDLRVSYSAGADALNVATILSCGALPVTGCSDLLKPGGYARLAQWLENLDAAMQASTAPTSLAAFVGRTGWRTSRPPRPRRWRTRATRSSCSRYGLPKVTSGLGLCDCVVAPCVEACAVEQDVPEYAWLIAQGDYDRALEVILARNPLPGVTGYVCTHLCQTRCTRNDYEETVAIRALKRIAEEHGQALTTCPTAKPQTGRAASPSIGSGPSGLSAAALPGAERRAGRRSSRRKDVPGGMMRLVPPFRLPLGDHPAGHRPHHGAGRRDRARTPDHGAAGGAAGSRASTRSTWPAASSATRRCTMPGIEGPGVDAALHLLDRSRRGERVDLGSKARGHRRRRHRDGRRAHVATAHRQPGHHPLPPHPARDAGQPRRSWRARWRKATSSRSWPRPCEILGRGGKVVGIWSACATRWASPARTAAAPPQRDPRQRVRHRHATRSSWPSASCPELTFLDGSRVTPAQGRRRRWWTRTTGCAGPDGRLRGRRRGHQARAASSRRAPTAAAPPRPSASTSACRSPSRHATAGAVRAGRSSTSRQCGRARSRRCKPAMLPRWRARRASS